MLVSGTPRCRGDNGHTQPAKRHVLGQLERAGNDVLDVERSAWAPLRLGAAPAVAAAALESAIFRSSTDTRVEGCPSVTAEPPTACLEIA